MTDTSQADDDKSRGLKKKFSFRSSIAAEQADKMGEATSSQSLRDILMLNDISEEVILILEGLLIF